MPKTKGVARKSSPPNPNTIVDGLSDILSGTLTVTINNLPTLKINGELKTVDVELRGLEESDLHLSSIFPETKKNLYESMKDSTGLAQALYKDGWNLRIFDDGERLLSMGRGITPLTGHVWLNPLKLTKLKSLT